jgi:hypothetical protein
VDALRLSREKWVLPALLLFTLLVRGSVLWAMRDKLQDDPDAYREIAENLLSYGKFALGKATAANPEYQPRPTAYRPPLYPIVLSNLSTADGHHVSLLKVAALHLLLGVATVWLTWLTARRVGQVSAARAGPPSLTGTERWAGGRLATLSHPTIAGLIVACDPILLNQQALIMTESLAAFLAILSLWWLARFDEVRSWFNAALAGGAIGLAALCRPTFLPWLGLVAVTMLLIRNSINSKLPIANWRFVIGWRLANVAAVMIAAVAVMLPWAIRNDRVFGKPIITTTHGGYTLLLANNDDFFDWLHGHDRTGLPWSSRTLDDFLELTFAMAEFRTTPGYVSRLLTEPGREQFCYEQAEAAIKSQPYEFVHACAYRIGQLWSPLPHKLTADESRVRQMLRYATCAWYCGVYALAVVGVWRFRWKLLQPPWIWGMLLCFAFTAVHTFYWTNLRMRAPLMPFVAIVAGAATIASKVQSPKSKVEGFNAN